MENTNNDAISNDRYNVLVPSEAFSIDDVKDAGSVELAVSHEDLLQLLVGHVDVAAFAST